MRSKLIILLLTGIIFIEMISFFSSFFHWDRFFLKIKQVFASTYYTQGLLESAIYDTQKIGGVVFNYVMWRGQLAADTSVDIQLASSNNSSGPWTFVGPDCSAATYYRDNPGVQQRLSAKCHSGHRYFRYKIYLNSTTGSSTPIVEDIIIGWSP